MLKELGERNLKKLLELIQYTYTNITNKDFLNIPKLIDIIKSRLKEELDFF
jgi:hypothetical protein